MKKQIILFFLTLLPMLASANYYNVEIDGIIYNLYSEGKVAMVMSNSNKYSGDVAIPASVTYEEVEYSVTSIGDEAFMNCSGLTSITILNSVTSIGEYAFCHCSGLASITIPNSVTNIDEHAFYGCTGLTSITIPNSVTSIGYAAFSDCIGLTSVDIPNSLMNISGRLFSGCTSLNYPIYNSKLFLYLPENYQGEYIIPNDISVICGGAFYDCTGLTSITIPNSVTSIGNEAFSGCTGLSSVTIPNSVTSINKEVFYNCSALTSATIPNSVTSIGKYAFSGCTGLNSIIIPNSVTNIYEGAFDHCSGLASLTIGNSVTNIGFAAFQGCTGLTTIEIPKSVRNIEINAFCNCTGLTSVHIEDLAAWSIINFESTTSNPLVYAHHLFLNGEEIIDLVIPNGVTRIANYAFSGFPSLISVTIPNSVTYIGQFAFEDCTSLSSVSIGSGIKKIDYRAFAYNPELIHVYCYAKDIPITSYQSAFDYSYPQSGNNNATLHVPEGSVDAYKTTKPWNSFGNVVAIESQTTPKCDTPTISYTDNKLTFSCETEDVEFVYGITDADIKQGNAAEVTLSATYEISVYATKTGYENSDVATATLVWSNASFTETTPATAIAPAEMKAPVPVLIQNNGGTLTIQGAQDGTPISVYTVAGMQAGTAVSQNSRATISTSMQQGDIAIIKIGERSVKIVLK